MASSERTPSDVDRIAEGWVDTLVELNPAVGTYIGRPTADDRLADYSPAGHERSIDAIRTTVQALRVRRAGRRHRPHHGRRPRQRARARARGPRRPPAPARPQRDREPGAGDPRGLRPHAHRLARRLGAHRHEARRRAARDRRLHRDPARRHRARASSPRCGRSARSRRRRTASRAPTASSARSPANAKRRRRRTGRAAATRARARGRRRGIRLRHPRRVPRAASSSRSRGSSDAVGRDIYALQSRHFLGAVDRPRRDLRVGHRGARAHGRRAGVDRQRDRAGGIRRRGDRVPRRRPRSQAARHRRAAAVDAGDERPGRRRARRDPVRHPRRDPHARVPDRAHAGGRHLLHRARATTSPARAACGGRCPRASPSSTRGASSRPSTTRACRATTCRSARPSYNRGKLNTWRRQLAGTSGHAEGWALYAERLMEELGYLDDPADRLGMLDGQRMRAARVVLDIGVHLGKQRPDGDGPVDGGVRVRVPRSQNVNMNEGFVRFEVNRYLGWPGQAPSYKVGQRIWEQLRDEVARREGGGVRHPRVPPPRARPRRRRPRHASRCAVGLMGHRTR